MLKLYVILLTLFFCGSLRAQTAMTIVADRDNTMFSAFANNSNGSGQYFFVGRNSPNNGSSIQRALLHFDLTGVPAGATITSATLSVYVNKSAPESTGIELHKVNSGWGEGTSDAAGNEASGIPATAGDATWNQRLFPSTTWGTAGGDFASTVSASAAVQNNLTSPTLIQLTGPDLVADIQGWLNNPSTNTGWMIKSSDETIEASVKRFISRNSSAVSQRPSLSITYSQTFPVNLKTFSGSLSKQNALLKWITATEIDNDYFQIEHSLNGKEFTPIAQVKASGSSTNEHAYTYIDENIIPGKHFYRITDVDKAGNKRFSQVISLSSTSNIRLQIYPNPARSIISITASSTLNGNEYNITSIAGQVVLKGIIDKQQIIVQKLLPGHYWFVIKTAGGDLFKTQFIKN